MSITSISALPGLGALSSGFNPYAGSLSGSKSVTHMANGATVTTLRGASGDIVSVTTAITAPPATSPVPQTVRSTVDVTA